MLLPIPQRRHTNMNKNKRLLQLFVLLFVLAMGTFLGIQFIKAQTNPPALVVHPSNLEINLTPGQPITGTIFLKNTTDKTITIQPHLKNFTAQGEEGGVDLTTDNTPFSLASWMKITPEKVDVPAGKEMAFAYTINPPTNAEPGGHFGSVVFATLPLAATTGGAGSAVSQEIAALILAKVPGDAREEAVVESLTSDKSFYEFGPVTFTMRVKNSGGVHIQPFGAVEVSDMFGNKVDAPLTPTNILPNAVRKVVATFPHNLLIGKYTAKIIASYGTKNKPLEGSVVFYAFPLRYGALLLVALLLLFVLRKRIGRAIKMMVTGK